MPIYMKIDGIKGDVTAEGHKDWIHCDSLQWGVSRSIGAPTGSAKERESAEPAVSEVMVTKAMDASSPYLFQESCLGKGKKVDLHICKTGTDQLVNYYEMVLENAMLSGYSVNSGGDNPSESVSLNFTKIETKYIPVTADGGHGDPIPAAYDLKLAKKP
jgi:type VI secretion system secreted protein Hcp